MSGTEAAGALAEARARRWFSISELAREFAITTRTIRFYEDEGMLAPLRRGRQRLYSQRERVRLKLILRGKRLGFSLAEIREIVDMYDAEPGEAGQLRHFLRKIDERRRELEQKRADIALTLRELADIKSRCRARLAELGEDGEAEREGEDPQ